MRTLILLLPAITLVFSISVLPADTIHVPFQQPTIQAGIDVAVDGDTVLVADGTYTGTGNRNCRFWGKAIVVMSANGPNGCIIDCQGSDPDRARGFNFDQGEGPASIVQGFTIKNGWTTDGSAIYCLDSSPTIRGNILKENYAYSFGGAIRCYGISSSPIIMNNVIINNEVRSRGGGIGCQGGSSPTIVENTISGNTAEQDGGGIYCEYSSPTITGNTITWNETHEGGGIYCRVSNPTITGNTISGNTAIGLYGQGGGFYFYISSPTITDNTITGNTANEGGGFYCMNSAPTITNCIFWNDRQDEIYIYSGSPSVIYSNVEGGWNGEGNIDEDPMFVLANKDDYRLLWDSPCIDTGDPNLFDADGTRSDMGAHYFNQDDFLTLYLTPDMTEMLPGDELGVTYTAINRWNSPEPFWLLSQVFLPGGSSLNVLGPDQYTLPANYTAQVHFTHPVPNMTPLGMYEYRSLIGMPPGTLYDDDSFTFKVIE